MPVRPLLPRLLTGMTVAGLGLGATPAQAQAQTPDPYLSLGGDLQVGALRYRAWGGGATRTGYQLGGGQAAVGRFGALTIGGMQGTLLRWFPEQGFSVSFLYDGWASVAVGPVQGEVRVGLTSFGLDQVLDDWSLHGLSPRVGAGVAVRSGRFLAGLFAFSEYSWRWMGQDLRIQGVYLDLRAEGKREPLE